MKDNWTNKLPKHSPEKATWRKIESELFFNEWMDGKILPNHEPAADSWEKIERSLSIPQKSVFRTSYRKKYWLAAAAVLVIFLINQVLFSSKEKVQVTYSTELENVPKTKIEFTDLKEIDKRCEEIKIVCNKLEIKDLRAEIEALSLESEALKEQVKVFGNDKAIVNAQEKVEAQKAQMVKQLIELMDNETHS